MRTRFTAAGGRTALSIAAMLALVIASLAYLGSVGLSVTDNRDVHNATMTIPESNGLVVGSRVLFRGVPIGKITGVETSISGVEISWNYKKNYEIPLDSDFRVDNLSALGETYLGIMPRRDGGSVLKDGVVLAAASVTVPTTVDELSARVTRLLEQINAQQVRGVIDEINTGLVADEQILTNIANASALLEATIVSTRGSLEDLLDRFQPLLVQGAQVGPSLAAAGDPVARFADGLALFLTEGGKKAGSGSPDGTDGFIVSTNSPTSLDVEAKPLLEHVQMFLDRSAPDLKILGASAFPGVSAASEKIRSVDLSNLMRTAMALAGNGNGLVVQVGGP